MILKESDTWSFRYPSVAHSDTANALSGITGDCFPAVLATTRCIALLELACAHLLVPLCQPGQLSVGVHVDVKHLAATPVGAWVEAQATYKGRNGKLYAFEVVARDPGGEIMTGRHERAIIDEQRLLAGAAARG
jgi:predicted thioesterase